MLDRVILAQGPALSAYSLPSVPFPPRFQPSPSDLGPATRQQGGQARTHLVGRTGPPQRYVGPGTTPVSR